jgi:RNA polymerase sigma-70 factor (ECF subfamily)
MSADHDWHAAVTERSVAGYDVRMRARGSSDGRPEFVEIVRDLKDDVWLVCCRLVDRQSADDLTQETFLRVYKGLPSFRGEASLRTWVFSIARRVCADEIRDLRRERRRQVRAQDHAAPDDVVPDIGDSVSLWASVATLEFDRRAAFVLTQVFGLTYEEAATVCDCPIGTIRSRVARARTDLIRAQGLPMPKPRTAETGGRYLPA